MITEKKENDYESITLKIEKIRLANPDKNIIGYPQAKEVITCREFDIIQMCKETPNDMELGKKLRNYINQNFK